MSSRASPALPTSGPCVGLRYHSSVLPEPARPFLHAYSRNIVSRQIPRRRADWYWYAVYYMLLHAATSPIALSAAAIGDGQLTLVGGSHTHPHARLHA